MSQSAAEVELLVCVRCRQGEPLPDDAERPGAALFRQMSHRDLPGVLVTPVECLSNCKQGCSVALRGPGRWTYVYGRLDPKEHAETLREGALKFAATTDGLIPWRERPEYLRKNCIARIPPLTLPPSQT